MNPLEGLNPAQREAVLHPGRAGLIVLAGPGTGKTRVITHRIARLIQDGAEPESILALTFTVKAAEQMRERLGDLVGPSIAERVWAQTYHGFGSRVLRRYGDRLGLSREWTLIDSARRTRLLREILRDERFFAGQRAAGVRALVEECTTFMRECGDAAVTFERCREHAREKCAALAAGSPEADRRAVQRLADHADVAIAYARLAGEHAWLSYHDLITLPIRILDEHPDAAAVIRMGCRHLVVDEFQDVDPAQLELIRRLAPPAPGGEGPDLCVVGDDDQAIYGFRGASPRAFQDFAETWTGHATVTLDTNYRSSPPILDVANRVIARAAERFHPGKRILAGRPAGGTVLPVQGCVIDDDHDAGQIVASLILQDHARHEGEAPFRWDRYAVIARGKSALNQVHAQLLLHSIPAQLAHGEPTGEDPVIKDLLNWVRVLTNPWCHGAAQELLLRPPFSLAFDRMSLLMRRYRAQTSRIEEGLDVPPEGVDADRQRFAEPFLMWTRRDLLERPADETPEEPLLRFLDLHAQLAAQCSGQSASEAIVQVIRRVGLALDPAPPTGNADDLARSRVERTRALASFLAWTRRVQEHLEAPGGLAQLIDYYHDLSEEERSDLGPSTEGPDIGDARAEGAAPEHLNAVQLLTAHKSKGLEFDTVFLVRVRPGGFPSKKKDERVPLLPDELRGPHGAPRETGSASDEERRTFYVACTRAERRLVLIAKTKKTRTETTDYFNELAHETPSPLSMLDPTDLLRRTGAERHLRLAPETTESSAPARHAGARARRAAREAMALALLELEALDPAAPADQAGAIMARISEAAAQIGAGAALERTGELPAWTLTDHSPARAWSHALKGALADSERTGAPATFFPRMTAPLSLSYSDLDAYQRCPLCWGLAHFYGIRSESDTHTRLGQAAHAAFERFYERFRAGDAEAPNVLPTRDDLLAYGFEALRTFTPRHTPAPPGEVLELRDMLANAYDAFHSDALHVLEVERNISIPYRRAADLPGASPHTLSLRIDRIDLLPDGGYRIVDYKSGRPSKRLTEPRTDDLQLGAYTLALPHVMEQPPDAPLPGVAEYWVLRNATRGVLDLARMRIDKIRKQIDSIITGMLAGEFSRKPDCTSSICAIVAATLGAAPASEISDD